MLTHAAISESLDTNSKGGKSGRGGWWLFLLRLLAWLEEMGACEFWAGLF